MELWISGPDTFRRRIINTDTTAATTTTETTTAMMIGDEDELLDAAPEFKVSGDAVVPIVVVGTGSD